jgi:hypothetical protein
VSEELYAGSPVAVLAAALGRPPGSGELGLVLARPGVGKTALLVHLALDTLLRDRQVLHVALTDTVDHARAHYDEVLRAVAGRAPGQGASEAMVVAERARMINSFHGRAFDPAAVRRTLEVMKENAQFSPDLIVVDGFDGDGLLAHVEALVALATDAGAALWASVRTEKPVPSRVWPHVRLAVRLTPDDRTVRLAVAHSSDDVQRLSLALDPTSMLVIDPDAIQARPEARYQPAECTLYSGGAKGAESAFGEAADRYGLHEVNFTFDGHLQERDRGRYVLSPRELASGDVSLTYVSKRLNRTYDDQGGLIRGVLQTLWHMVSRSQQVFMVGRIQDDGTVRGGTGWSVELARMWNRDLWVYDQDKVGWYHWEADQWVAGTPVISALHFTGTGTRMLNDDGQAAIDDLFERSFAQR